MARIDPERAAALYAEHQRLAPVADIMGVSVPGLWLCLKRRGVPVITRTQALKALNADPEFKAKISKLSAARMKALNADPEFKAKISKLSAARMKALHADPEFKAAAAARMKALHADPEFKAAAAARMKALYADPEFKARRAAAVRRHFAGCEVPGWVPADLHDDYLDWAKEYGEEAAASHVRRLKREAAQ